MATKVSGWKADDGTLFATQQEAEDHDMEMLWADRVSAYCSSDLFPYTKGRCGDNAGTSMALRIIIGWERYKVAPPEKKG